MALLEKHRSVIYDHLVEHVGEEAAEAMLAQFPTRDIDEPVTKEFIALQIAELRTEMHQLFSAADGKILGLRTEMHQEFGLLRGEIHQHVGDLRTEMHQEFSLVRAEIHQQIGLLRNEIAQGLGDLRSETRGQIATLNGDITTVKKDVTTLKEDVASLRVEMHQQNERLMNRLQLVAGLAVVGLAAVNALLG